MSVRGYICPRWTALEVRQCTRNGKSSGPPSPNAGPLHRLRPPQPLLTQNFCKNLKHHPLMGVLSVEFIASCIIIFKDTELFLGRNHSMVSCKGTHVCTVEKFVLKQGGPAGRLWSRVLARGQEEGCTPNPSFPHLSSYFFYNFNSTENGKGHENPQHCFNFNILFIAPKEFIIL